MTQTKQIEDLSVKGTAIILPEANMGESAYGNERFRRVATHHQLHIGK